MTIIRPLYGEKVRSIYGTGSNKFPILSTHSLLGPQISALYVKVGQERTGLLEPIPPEDTFIVSVSPTGASQYEMFSRGQPIASGGFSPDSLRIGHLIDGVQSHVYQPFEAISLLIRRAALDAFTEEEGYRRVEKISCPYGIIDATMANLTKTLIPLFVCSQKTSALFTDHVVLAIIDHLITRYGASRIISTAQVRGGLTSSQMRLVQEMLFSDLGGKLRIADVAKECGISRQHLTNSFKKSTGYSPHQWLQRTRVDRAKDMLKFTKYKLEYIAAQCGFASQSHLTNVFKAIEGTPPTVWRRQNKN